MHELLEDLLEGKSGKGGFGMAATTIWIMGLPVELRMKFADSMANLFIKMSAAEVKAVKYYVAHDTWMECPELPQREAA